MNEDTRPQGDFKQELKSSVIAATAICKIHLDNALKNSLYSFPDNENPYSKILHKLSEGRTNISVNKLILKK